MEDPSFERLDTPRLQIRRFRTEDAAVFARYRSDPEVARFQAWDIPYTIEEARRFVDETHRVSPGRAGTWFQFAVGLKPEGSLIGDCALHTTRADPRQAELGFSFAVSHQRQGYAMEAVQCVVAYAFSTLVMHRVFAITDIRNIRAQRLLERLGFRREGHFVENIWFKGEWSSEFLYAYLRAEWMRRAR